MFDVVPILVGLSIASAAETPLAADSNSEKFGEAMAAISLFGLSLLILVWRWARPKSFQRLILWDSGQGVVPIGIVQVVVGMFVIGIVNSLATFFVNSPTTLSALVAVSAGCLVLSIRAPEIRAWLLIRPVDFAKDAGRGIVVFLAIIPWILLLHSGLSQLVPYQHTTLTSLEQNRSWSELAPIWVKTVVWTPLIEEFLFRGLLIYWLVQMYPPKLFSPGGGERFLLGRWFGPQSDPANGADQDKRRAQWFGIVLAALLFASAHYNQGLASVPLFFLALFWGKLFLASRSLWPCILTHALLNSWSLFWKTFHGPG